MKRSDIAQAVVEAARRWIGTPYRHQCSVRAVGCDCLGLVRGVWRELYGAEPAGLPAYTPDWGEVAGRETVLETAAAFLRPVADAALAPGHLLVFRWRAGMVAKHLGVATGPDRFIHAWEAAGVCEVSLGIHWRRRIAAVFSFPEIAKDA